MLSEALPAASLERLVALVGTDPDALPEAIREAARDAGLDPDGTVLQATRVAGRLNGRDIVPLLAMDRRYHAEANAKPPRRIDSVLDLYDCINCDLCVPACPNDAIFVYAAEPRAVDTHIVSVGPEGLSLTPGAGFAISEEHQLALFEGACNECSNCEVYCPEDGAPFRVKERLFPSHEVFAGSPDDGFWRSDGTLHARLGGRVMRLVVDEQQNRAALDTEGLHLELTWNPLQVVGGSTDTQSSAVDRHGSPVAHAHGVGLYLRGRPIESGESRRTVRRQRCASD